MSACKSVFALLESAQNLSLSLDSHLNHDTSLSPICIPIKDTMGNTKTLSGCFTRMAMRLVICPVVQSCLL